MTITINAPLWLIVITNLTICVWGLTLAWKNIEKARILKQQLKRDNA